MRAIENLTAVNNNLCVQFRPKNATDLYYITIFNGSGCYAPVNIMTNIFKHDHLLFHYSLVRGVL